MEIIGSGAARAVGGLEFAGGRRGSGGPEGVAGQALVKRGPAEVEAVAVGSALKIEQRGDDDNVVARHQVGRHVAVEVVTTRTGSGMEWPPALG